MAAITEIVRDLILDQKLDEASSTQKHRLGLQVETAEGARYMYVQADANGVTGQGYAVVIDASNVADMTDTTNVAQLHPYIGRAATNGAVAASEYFWACLDSAPGAGPGLRVAASCAADVALYPTATEGVIDDAVTAGTELLGLSLRTAAGGAEETNTSVVARGVKVN